MCGAVVVIFVVVVIVELICINKIINFGLMSYMIIHVYIIKRCERRTSVYFISIIYIFAYVIFELDLC
jgi:hypothetical protein